MGDEHLRAQWTNLVTELRCARGNTSQRQLAEQRGLSVTAFQDWELLQDWPTVPHLIDWAYDVGLQLVVVDDEHPAPANPAIDQHAPFAQREYAVHAATLRQARKVRRIDQETLAGRLYASRWAVLRWESGRCPRSTSVFLAWIHAVGCRPLLTQRPGHAPDLPLPRRDRKRLATASLPLAASRLQNKARRAAPPRPERQPFQPPEHEVTTLHALIASARKNRGVMPTGTPGRQDAASRDRLVRAWRDQGATPMEIAKLAGVSEPTVWSWLDRRQVARRQAAAEPTATPPESA